jgi:thiol-disulfide isomerase/thioredoxin
MQQLRIFLLAALALGLCRPLYAQDTALTELRRAMQRGTEALTAKNYKLAERSYKRALELSKAKAVPDKIRKTVVIQAHYNSACCHALLGQSGAAIKALRLALQSGFNDWGHLEEDKDLASLRGVKDFQKLIAKARGSSLEKILKGSKDKVEEARKKLSEDNLFDFRFESKAVRSKQAMSLSKSRGKVVIVDIWGSSFKVCETMIPIYKDLQSRYRAHGLLVMGLAYERGEDNEKQGSAERFLKREKVNYLSGLATDKIIDQIPKFGGFPTALLIDRQGRVRKVLVGRQGKEELLLLVLALLTEKRVEKTGESAPGKKVTGKKAKKTAKAKEKLHEAGPF